MAAAAVTRRRVTALAATTRVRRGGESLDDAVAGEHAAIDGKVPADHKGTHGSVLLRQDVRLVGQVRLVLTPVYENKAGEAVVASVAFVGGVCPSAPTAKACKQSQWLAIVSV